ncbi:DNA-binding transcriptional ArsR family regulator [Dyella sp. SG562]|nr:MULTISPECIES: metalloregulator ArsR/SmtB family transcription factor [unclassified Dyella]MBT2117979.1 ArsR family transcriptional regulator [Dyella sp. LX-1]MBT2140886.1 ArsR family transcriptional regulator [Dyella sp. LX-66]NII73034.1 DNA-binding transcriptional ArsR family regulator [Dyella sp. SG562]NKJ19725.1 DNA-binding transcriptional ArsR family regulator [Dyella sp. SG609]
MSTRSKPIAAPALQRAAPIFAALGDATRLRLVALLCAGGAMSIAQLTVGTEISRQAVTKHLQVLADAGLVRDAKLGRERRWELEPSRLDEARRSLDAIAAQWDAALLRLKDFVEN